MNIESKKYAIKIIALLFLVILFSTNYYGGNSLFFLEDNTLFILRVFLGTAGSVLLIIYFALKNKEKRELTKRKGRLYTKEAIRQMEDYGISEESIELAIEKGIKKEGRLNTFYTYSSKDSEGFTVMLNDKGYIVTIFK